MPDFHEKFKAVRDTLDKLDKGEAPAQFTSVESKRAKKTADTEKKEPSQENWLAKWEAMEEERAEHLRKLREAADRRMK